MTRLPEDIERIKGRKPKQKSVWEIGWHTHVYRGLEGHAGTTSVESDAWLSRHETIALIRALRAALD